MPPLSGPGTPKKKKKTDASLLETAPAEEATAQAPPPADAVVEKTEAVSAPDISTANAPKAIAVTPEMAEEDAPEEQEQPQEQRGFFGKLWDMAADVKERYDRDKERRDTWYGKSLESRRKVKSLQEVDAALLDQENHFRNRFPGYAPEARRDLMVSSTVDLYLAHATGRPLPQDVEARNRLRDEIAQRDFGGEGVKDDKAFHARLVKGATRRMQQGEIFTQVVAHARASAVYELVGTKGALVKNAQGNMVPGERLANPLTFASFRQKASTLPGYSPEMDHELLSAWTAAAKVARNEGILPYKETFERQWRDTQQYGQERAMQMLLDPKGDFQMLVNTGIERGIREKQGGGGEQMATPMSEMMKTIKSLGYYPSYTSATTSAVYKGLRRAKDGKWKTAPLVPISKDNDWRDKAVLAANVTHQRWAGPTELDGPLAQRVEEIQKEWNLTDRQVTVLWQDMGNLHREWDKDEGPFRTLSNGQILPNPLSDEWLDSKNIRRRIRESSASEESKKETLLLLFRYQDEIASNKLEGYRLSFGVTNEIVRGAKIPTPDEWAKQQGREHEIHEPEFIQEYEHKVLVSAGVTQFVLHGWAASGVKGLNKVANIGTGIAGFFGSESATEYGVNLHEANRIIGNGQFDMGAAGMLIEESPALIIQLALTRGIGMGAGAGARAVGATGAWGARAVKLTAISAAAITAGGQSASSTFLQSRSEGRSDKEAREDAINAGLVTAIITGTFSLAGAGGPERFATNVAGKTGNAMQAALAKVPGATRLQHVTVGQLVKALPKGQARDAIKRFAKATIQAGAEGTEEGLDQLVNKIITADPDTNLASLWSEVSDAFMAGVLLGAGAEGVDITATLAKRGFSPEAIGNEYRFRDRPTHEPSAPAPETAPASDAGKGDAPADAPASAEQTTTAPAEGVSPGNAAPDGQAPAAEGATAETQDAPEGKWTASSPGEPGLTSAPQSGAQGQTTPAGQPAQDGAVPAAPGIEQAPPATGDAANPSPSPSPSPQSNSPQVSGTPELDNIGGADPSPAAPAVSDLTGKPLDAKRAARAIKPIVISTEALPGNKKDWHKAVRDYILEHLVGKILVNRDSGKDIKFTSLSKREAPSKLRREEAFRSAFDLSSITEQAIFIGDIAPAKGKTGNTERFEYFAIPVLIDGKQGVAWFNALKPTGENHSVFYEFGLHLKKTAPDFQRASASGPEGHQPVSKSGTGITVADFLQEIKTTLPAAIKIHAEANNSTAANPTPSADSTTADSHADSTGTRKPGELSHDQAAATNAAHPTPQAAGTLSPHPGESKLAEANSPNASIGSPHAKDTEEARAAQRPLGEAEPPFQVTSQPGPGGNVTDPLHPIKDASGAPANVSDPSPVQNEPGLPEESGAGTEAPGASSKSGPTTNISDSPGQSKRKSPANPETAAKVAIEREAAATIVNNARAGGMDDASAHRHAAQTAPAAAAATTLAEDLADHLPQTRRAAGDIAHALTQDASTPSPAPDHLPSRLAPSLAEDVPNVPWTLADRTGILDGEWTSDPATLQDLLPKVTNATSPDTTAEKRANAFRSLTDQELTALGVPPQDIPALREALDGTDFNAIRAGMVALRKLKPHSTDARDAASDLAETAASDKAAVPSGDTTIQRLPNGRYRVHDPATGEEIGQAPNRSAAVRMAQLAAENANPPADSADGDPASDSGSDPADASPDGDTPSPSPDPDMDTTGDVTTDPADGSDPGATSLLKITDSTAKDPAMLTDPAAPADPASTSATTDPSGKVKHPKENAKTRKAAKRKKIHDEYKRAIPPDPTKKWSQEFYEETARQATINADSTTVVLGKYWHPNGRVYTKVAGQRGATYFKVENWKEVTGGMNRKQIFEINKAFLRQQYLLGKEFIFSHDPGEADGFLMDEVNYLKDLGYIFPARKSGWVWEVDHKDK